jgi:hypothetical protein
MAILNQPGAKSTRRNAKTMNSKSEVDNLISQRWPKLKGRAQREKNPQKLIAILEEIDDLLFNVEMRIAAQSGQADSRNKADERTNSPQI